MFCGKRVLNNMQTSSVMSGNGGEVQVFASMGEKIPLSVERRNVLSSPMKYQQTLLACNDGSPHAVVEIISYQRCVSFPSLT